MKNKLQLFFSPCLGASVVLFFYLLTGNLSAQQANVPLNHEWIQESESRMVSSGGFSLNYFIADYDADSAFHQKNNLPNAEGLPALTAPIHSSMRPWIEQGHPLRKNILIQNSTNQKTFIRQQNRFPNEVKDYHTKNSLVNIERKPQNGEPLFRLYIDPLANFQYTRPSQDESQKRFYINTRGITARGDIGTKISFETSFYENQAFFPQYIADFANNNLVIPGQGRWKKFKNTGYDYAYSTGYISYSPCKSFNMQIGSGKHFVGDGYRSLLLSDNSFSYPFARFTGWFGPQKMFQYTAIYASLMNLYANAPTPIGSEKLFQKKAASFYQLSANIGRIAEVTLFQGLIWSAADNRNKQCITLAYVNPVMFTSIPAFGMSDRNNFLLGATFHLDVMKTARIYGQVVMDEFGKKGTIGNKNGFQLGVKYFNAFKVKHLHLELEYNKVNPYTYAAGYAAQSYTHYNQPLAHPLGANFSEVVGSMYYKAGDFYLNIRASSATLGADTAGRDFGQNVFTATTHAYAYPVTGDNKVGQGEKTTISWFDLSFGYMINYASNLNVCIGYTNRKVVTDVTTDHTQFVYVAVRTSLTNTYYDFFRK